MLARFLAIQTLHVAGNYGIGFLDQELDKQWRKNPVLVCSEKPTQNPSWPNNFRAVMASCSIVLRSLHPNWGDHMSIGLINCDVMVLGDFELQHLSSVTIPSCQQTWHRGIHQNSRFDLECRFGLKGCWDPDPRCPDSSFRWLDPPLLHQKA